MKLVFTLLFILPSLGFSQYTTVLKLNMHDYSEFVVYLDAVKYDLCDEISINSLKPGLHKLKVYKQKKYFNVLDNSSSTRLISVYNGEITILENRCTSCVIDKFHQNNTIIR